MLLNFSATALAADSVIIFKGAQEGFESQPGSSYTETDLFDQFKNVMPGDRLTETVKLKNEASDCDYIKLYLRAVVHDEVGNPLTYSEAFESLDGKDQDGIDGARDETVATMQDFLSKLTMRIYNGGTLIYNASPEEAGALVNAVLLGSLGKGESLDLRVELDVPASLDNRYANRVGEVDWVFLAECFEFDKLTVHKVWDDNKYPERPESITVQLLRDDELYAKVILNEGNQWTHTWSRLSKKGTWTVREEVPEGYEVSYKTEDNLVFITNTKAYEPPFPPEPVEVKVIKHWDDQDNKNGIRPSSVVVTLYNGTTAVDKQLLNRKNGWSYTWKDLDGSCDWSVLETNIPSGYAPSYKIRNGVVIITNTSKLIQTGQLTWPIPVLGGLGILLIIIGVCMMRRKKEIKNAK